MNALPVRGVLIVDLSTEPMGWEARGRLSVIDEAPAGVEVIIRLGEAWIWPDELLLHGLGLHRFRITVEGAKPEIVGAWINWLRRLAAAS